MKDKSWTLSKPMINKKLNDKKYKIKRQINKYVKVNDNELTAIAGFNFTGIKNLQTDFDNIISIQGIKNKQQSIQTNQEKINIEKKVISSLDKHNLFGAIHEELSNTKKTQKGSDLIKNVVKINNMKFSNAKGYNNTSYQSLDSAINKYMNILKNGGNIISFDTETLGGINAYGNQELDFITELAASAYEYTPGKGLTVKESMQSLLGITDKEYKNLSEELEKISKKNPKDYTGKEKVLIHRLSMMSDDNIITDMQDLSNTKINPFEVRIKDTSKVNETIEDNIDNAKKGLYKYREIGKYQELIANNDLDVARKKYIEDFTDFVSKGKTATANYNDALLISQNGSIFDIDVLGIKTGKSVNVELEHLDNYQAIKYIESIKGQGAHLNGLDPADMMHTASFGTGTEDFLKTVSFNNKDFNERLKKLNIDLKQSHNAGIDERVLAEIVTDPTYSMSLLDAWGDTKREMVEAAGNIGIANSNGVFLQSSTDMKLNGGNNALSFAYNPISKSFKTYDGYNIDDNGITKQSFNQFGPKEGALYQRETYKISLQDEKWKKVFKDTLGDDYNAFYQKYSHLDNIYVTKSTQYKDKKTYEKKFGKGSIQEQGNIYYSIFATEEEAAASYGKQIGKVVDDRFIPDDVAIKSLGLRTTYIDNKGKIQTKVLSEKEAINSLLKTNMTKVDIDSAAREARNQSYKSIQKLRLYNKNNTVDINTKIATLIANNKQLPLEKQQSLVSQLINTLGWTDIKTGNKVLLPETIRKTSAYSQYVNDIDPIVEAVERVFNEMGLEPSFKINTLESTGENVVEKISNSNLDNKKEFLYRKAFNDVIETVTQNPGKMNGSFPVALSDLDIVDFKVEDLYPKIAERTVGSRLSNFDSQYMSIQLNKKNSLLKAAMNYEYKYNDRINKNSYETQFNALFKLYKKIGKDERFTGVWNGFNEEDVLKYLAEEKSLTLLNNEMAERLKKYIHRKRQVTDKNGEKINSGFGLLFPRRAQDLSTANVHELIANQLEDNPDYVYNIVKKSIGNINFESYDITDVFSKDGKVNKKIIDNLVNNYYMTFSKEDLIRQLNSGNFTEGQKNTMLSIYEASKKEARLNAIDLIEGLRNTDISLQVVGKGKNANMFLTRGNEARSLLAHKYIIRNGTIRTQIGNQEYATQLTYNVNKYYKYKETKNTPFNPYEHLTITNSVEEQIQKTKKAANITKEALAAGYDPLDELANTLNRRYNSLREVTPRKEIENFANAFERSFYVREDGLISIMPELMDTTIGGHKIIDLIDTNFVSKENKKYVKDFKKLLEKIKDNRPDSLDDLLSYEQSMYNQIFRPGFIYYVNQVIDYSNIPNGQAVKEAFSHASSNIKDTNYAKGILSINDSPFAHGLAKFDNADRPPQFQYANTYLNEKKKVRKSINKYLTANSVKNNEAYKLISPEVITSSKAAQNFIYAAEKDTQSAGMTLKTLQINTNNLLSIMENDINKVKSGDFENIKQSKFYKYVEENFNDLSQEDKIRAAQNLADKAASMSTYEQQSFLDARVAYAAFSNTNKQSISSKKELIINHQNNLDTINNLKRNIPKLYPTIDDEGRITYSLGYEVKAGESLGLFNADGENIVSKWNGVYRTRYYKDGNLVSEGELNKLIKKKGIKNPEEITQLLNNEYDLVYEVIQKADAGQKKLVNSATEKNTADDLAMSLGSIDKSIINDIEEAFNKKDIPFDRNNMDYLSESYIEEYLRPIVGDKIADKLLKERFSLSDALKEFDELKDVQQILAVNSLKHETVSMPLEDVLNRIKQNEKDKDIKSLYSAIFKTKDNQPLEFGRNGAIITDNVDRIKVQNFTEKDFENNKNAKELADKLNKYFSNESVEYLEKDGQRIGVKQFGSVTQVRDDQAGTYSSYRNKDDLIAKNKAIDKMLKNNKLDDDVRDKLLKDKTNNEILLGKLSREKGIKYSKNMSNILGMQTFNNDYLSIVKERFESVGLQNEFEDVFGDVLNNKGEVSDEYLGKKVLEPIIEGFNQTLRIGPNETPLSKIHSMSPSDKNKYDYLLKAFKGQENNISIEKAEQLYGINQGLTAIKFNNLDPIQSSVKFKNEFNRLTNLENEYDNFKFVDLTKGEKLDLDIGGQGEIVVYGKNNPYRNNLMIKFGENENDVFAVSRMPEKHFKDTLIKEDHISILNSIQRQVDIINNGDNTTEAIDKLNGYVSQFKRMQIKDITSKEGLFGEALETRMAQSFIGKASSGFFNSLNEDLDNIGANYYERLKKANPRDFLDTASFRGKSILKHFSEGKALDYVEVSEKAFEDMGYFDKEFMANIFKKMDTNIKGFERFNSAKQLASNINSLNDEGMRSLRESMIDLLSTQGDVFIGLRYPEIQEGSDKPVLTYLNKQLKDNQIRFANWTGLSMNLDYDGDQPAIVRAINKNKQSYLDYVVNPNAANEELRNTGKALEASILGRSTTANRYWVEESNKQMAKELKFTTDLFGNEMNKSRFKDFVSQNLIDDELMATWNPSQELNVEKMSKLLNNDNINSLVKQSIEDGNHNEAIATLKSLSIDNNGNYDEELFNSLKEDYRNAYAFNKYLNSGIAKSSKSAIGEMNVKNTKIFTAFQNLVDKTSDNYNFEIQLMKDFSHLSEQAVISSKHSIEGLDPDRAKTWNESALNLITGQGNKEQLKETMFNWANEHIVDDLNLGLYFESSKKFRKTVEDLTGETFTTKTFAKYIKDEANIDKVNTLKQNLARNYIDVIDNLGSATNINRLINSLSLGQSKTGTKRAADYLISTDNENNMQVLTDMLKSIHSENKPIEFLDNTEKIKPIHAFSEGSSAIKEVIKEDSKALKNSLREDVMDTAGKMFNSIKNSHLGIGALGVAAGIMTLGFVGGRPIPADTQAMNESDESQGPMQYQSLADPGLYAKQSNNGYVININARTEKSKDDTARILQQAFSSGASGNINIAMNINDNYGNINDRDLEKALADIIS